MIIWQGLGWVPFVLVVVIGLLLIGLSGGWENDDIPNWVFAVSMISAAPPTALLGVWLRSKGAKSYIDAETGERVTIRNKHTLFFVPIEYLSIGMLLLGIYGFFAP